MIILPQKTLGFAALLVALAAASERPARAEYVGNKYTDAATGEVLEYNIFVPTGYDATKKYPLMVVLHAANTNQIPPPRTLSSDGKGWAATFISDPHQAKDPSFFMIPISQTNASGWGEATQPITSVEKFEGRLTVSVLKQVVLAKYNIDPNRLYITGPSMGGRGTWDIIRRYPGVFAAAAPAAAPASPADAALYAGQNIWAICGEVDPIVQGERDTIVAIRKVGGNPIYTELQGTGHTSWRPLYPAPQFVEWMFAQRLGVPWTMSAVSTAPVIPGLTLTPGWPQVVPPTGGTGGSAGGGMGGNNAGGVGGSSSAGGAAGTAGSSGSGGRSGTGGSVGTGTGGASSTATGGAVGSGGAIGLPASGGAPAASGGQPGSGGVSGTGTGGVSRTGTGGSSGGSGIDVDGGGGCSVVAGRAVTSSLGGLLALLGVLALRRRRRAGDPPTGTRRP